MKKILISGFFLLINLNVISGQKMTTLLNGINVFGITEDHSGNLWVITYENGLYRISGNEIKNFTTRDGLSYKNLESVYVDSKNRIWIGTGKTGITADGKGICLFDGKQWSYYTEKEGLSSNAVFSFFEDSKGRMWCGTSKGVDLLTGDKWENIDNIKIERFTAPVFFESDNGDIWFMYERGIFKYNEKGVTRFDESSGLAMDASLSWTRDRDGNYWFGHFRRHYSRFDGTKFETRDVGTFNVISFWVDKGQYTHEPVKVFCDSKNILWIEAKGMGGGLYKYEDGRPEKIMEKEGLTYFHQIIVLNEDKKGNMWFGTADQGACRFDGSKWYYYEKPELPSNLVSVIFTDSKGTTWLCTNKGLVKTE